MTQKKYMITKRSFTRGASASSNRGSSFGGARPARSFGGRSASSGRFGCSRFGAKSRSGGFGGKSKKRFGGERIDFSRFIKKVSQSDLREESLMFPSTH